MTVILQPILADLPVEHFCNTFDISNIIVTSTIYLMNEIS